MRLPLLRHMRSMHFVVLVNWTDHWTVQQLRLRLDYVVAVFNAHADDENQKALLHELKVDFKAESTAQNFRGYRWRYKYPRPRIPPVNTEKCMFILDSLAALRGIKKVEITGLPDWYARCLQTCIQGKGGDVQETDWPLIRVKKQRDYTKTPRKVWVTTRKWYNPIFNWKEFAERNGIDLPEDIDRFWGIN